MVPRTGFEPVTVGLEIRCSIQLSYRGNVLKLFFKRVITLAFFFIFLLVTLSSNPVNFLYAYNLKQP